MVFDPHSIREPVQFDVRVELGAPPDVVFAFVANFPTMPTWMPLIKRVEVDNSRAETPGGVGAVRVIYPPVGPATLETVKGYEPPRLLAYSAADASLMGMYTNHTGILTFEPTGRGTTELRWLTHANPGRNPIMRFLGRFVFDYVIESSTESLRRRFPIAG